MLITQTSARDASGAGSAPEINPKTYAAVSGFLKQASGFSLPREKSYLIRTRLNRLLPQFGLKSVDEIAVRLVDGKDEELSTAVVEAMTTNETLFFRDGHPFDTLREQIFPALCAKADRRIVKVLCAAASTGQEPYSIAMTALESAAFGTDRRIEILATDIDSKVLRKADEGVFTKFEVQRGVPSRLLVKYFEEHPTGGWRISRSLRSMVEFKQANLIEDISGLGTFDVIFCRNVLIYFDVPTKSQVLASLAKLTRGAGYLFLGSSETATGLTELWQPMAGGRSVFKLARGH